MDAEAREFIIWRAGNSCEYCRIPQAATPYISFHVEHVVARQHSGPDSTDNMALACYACNHHKSPNLSSIDWESGGGEIARLFHPHKDRWDDHFEWHGQRLHGKTPVGRATILCLGINLPHRVALRENLAYE
jgi:HNH endonuclease